MQESEKKWPSVMESTPNFRLENFLRAKNGEY